MPILAAQKQDPKGADSKGGFRDDKENQERWVETEKRCEALDINS